ncbi:MAG: UDP-N-acetylmuramoyl-tripeptide--D-alanyl-D-alanine ligase [Nitrospirota bacterium]|nr:UDP-N-acetylmuramoyl-tripeptide--D-alanyl-D-alanine ligase [Nitrospirota bacterium]
MREHGHRGVMALFTVEEICEVLSAKAPAGLTPHDLKQRIRRVMTDSRLARKGDLFIAFQGDRFNGHAFVAKALAQGAVCAVVQEDYRLPPLAKRAAAPMLLAVRDTLEAYQRLAAHYRNRFPIPVIAITGSNGKTTTKDMVAQVVAQRWKTLKTEGNLNNRIGVPQTLFQLAPRHQAAVIEMGVDQQGQTSRLCEIAKPTIGVITNIGPDHLEFFGSMEGSAQAKAELLDHLPQDGAVVLNADDGYFEYLAARARCRVVAFGCSPKAEIRAVNIRIDEKGATVFGLVLPGKSRQPEVRIRTQGAHNVSNALAAAGVGFVLGLSGTAIAEGLAKFRPAAMRSQISTLQGVQVINDCYNANPASMKAAIQLLAELGRGKRSIAVLGDMLELGADSKRMHREVGAFLAGQGIEHLLACGVLGRELAEGARQAGMPAEGVTELPDAATAGTALTAMVRRGDVVLVKASRGMRMEQIVETVSGLRRVATKAC